MASGARRLLAATTITLLTLAHAQAPPKETSPKLTLHPTRQSPDDLEITGMLANLAPGAPAYVTYDELSHLPQTTIRVTNDENFPTPVTVTGIPLDQLARALGASPNSDLIDALCTDDYRAHYPASYIALHHPLFALLIDRQRPASWAARTHQYDPSPYFMTHAHFVHQINILAHREQPQVPSNIIRLNFSTTAATYGAITPRGPHAQDPQVQQGFAIAKQTCLRCHNRGSYGGTKSGRDWGALSTWAREQPAYFTNYVRNPQAIEPHAHMPPNPSYDQPTLSALAAYFQTFTAAATSPK